MYYVLLDVCKIQYNIYNDGVDYSMSKIIKPNREPVYADICYNIDGNYNEDELALTIYNGTYEYDFIDYLHNTVINSMDIYNDLISVQTHYNNRKLSVMRYNMRINNINHYNIFSTLMILRNYIPDLSNLAIAFGRDIYMIYKVYLLTIMPHINCEWFP
jgi:hypothetical protein